MGKHLLHDPGVEVDDEAHGEHVATREDAAHEQLRVERVGQIVECA